MRKGLFSVLLVVVSMAGLGETAWAQFGIKGGLVFPQFSSDVLDFDNRIGWQAGVFFTPLQSSVAGFQGEVNWVRKRAESDALSGFELDVDYLQIPLLLRLQTPSTVKVYGIVGPTLDFKLRESLSGTTVSNITDGFKGFDIGGVVGAGVEFGAALVEGRYSRGFRQINESFSSAGDLKSHSFAVLVGVHFD